MKIKYPAEAFALGMVLFSAGMKEAFAAGILVILAVVFAEVLKNLLESGFPAGASWAACAWGQQRLAPAPFCWAFQLLVWKWNGEPGL